jgi:phage terminase small subunit
MSTSTKKIEYDKLSAKQQRFVDEYCVDFNGTQAAIRAGYSVNTASMQAARLLTKDKIKTALEEKRVEIAEESKLKASDVIDELRRIAFSDITQVMSFTASKAKVKSSRKLSEDAKKIVASVSQTRAGLTVKLHDKVKALELLGRYLNIFTDRVEVEGRGLGLILNMNAPVTESSEDIRCVEVDKVLQDSADDSNSDSAADSANDNVDNDVYNSADNVNVCSPSKKTRRKSAKSSKSAKSPRV